MIETSPPLLELRDIVVRHRSQRSGLFCAVDGVCLKAIKGQRTLIVGRSGAGKSSLLNSMFTPDRGTPGLVAGQICFQGRHLFPDPPAPGEGWRWERRVRCWQRRCRRGMKPLLGREWLLVPQGQNLFVADRSMGAQVEEALTRRGRTGPDLRAVFKEFELDPAFLDQSVRHRSPGERQRMYLALAHALQPELLCLDEPTSGLDPPKRHHIAKHYLKCGSHQAMIVVSHDLELCDFTDHVVVFYRGTVVERCPADQFRSLARPRHPYTTALLGARKLLREALVSKKHRMPKTAVAPPKGCPYLDECRAYARLSTTQPSTALACEEQQPPEVMYGEIALRCWAPDTLETSSDIPRKSSPSVDIPSATTLVQLCGLTRRVGNRKPRRLFENLYLDLHAREDIAIVGPSGEGKTQLAKALCGFVRDLGGQIIDRGLDSDVASHPNGRTLNGTKRPRVVHNRLCYFPQDPDDLMRPEQTVNELLTAACNLSRAIHSRPSSRAETRAAINDMLGRLQLQHLAKKRASELTNSGGEKTRIALARTLLSIGFPTIGIDKPHVLVTDEPVTSLDVEARLAVLSLLLEATSKPNNLTLVVITHEIEIARLLAKKIYVLQDGKLTDPIIPYNYAVPGNDLACFQKEIKSSKKLDARIIKFLAPQ